MTRPVVALDPTDTNRRKTTLHVLLVSLGSIGERHLANLRKLRPEASVDLLHLHRSEGYEDPRHDRVREVFHDLDTALDAEPDAGIVACPANEHVRVARRMVERSIPAFVEKPLAIDPQQGRTLVEAVASSEAFVAVGYNFRFHPAVRALERAVGERAIGDLRYVRAEAGQYLPTWRSSDYRDTVSARRDLGGGALLELSHEIDYVRWIAGEVVAVQAHVDRLSDLEIDVEDTAEIVLELANGAVASVHLDMIQRTPVRRCRMAGTEATVAWRSREGEVVLDRPGEEPEPIASTAGFDRNEMYKDELEAFLDCVEDGGEPAVSAEDGLRTLRVVEAARRAAETSRRVEV